MTQEFAAPTITTKYLGPTNYRGGRIRATGPRDSVTVSWDHALEPFANHRLAAESLAVSMGWNPDDLIGGWMSDSQGRSKGYAFILATHLDVKPLA